MVDNLIKRAKAFIGLDEEVNMPEEGRRQMDFGQITKKEKRQSGAAEGQLEIIVHEPKVYEDSLSISHELRSGNPVIVNLLHLEPTEGTRLIDFVCGTAYAIDGHMIKIAEAIFLFTPREIIINDVEGRSSLEKGMAGASDEAEEESMAEKFFSRR